MLLIYQVICGALALLVGAVVLRPASTADASTFADRGRRPTAFLVLARRALSPGMLGGPKPASLGLQVTGALVLVPLLLRLFLVK